MYNAMRTVLQGREAELEKALNLDYTYTLLKVIGEDIARTGGGKDAESKLERVIDSICTTERKLMIRQRVLARIGGWIQSPDYNGERTVDWKAKLAELTDSVEDDSKRELDKRVKDRTLAYKRAVFKAGNPGQSYEYGDDDDDVVVEGVKAVVRCPLSRELLKDPFKNRSCGHVFSKAEIFAAIGRRGAIPCPVSGCSKTVTKESLIRAQEAELVSEPCLPRCITFIALHKYLSYSPLVPLPPSTGCSAPFARA